MKSTKIIVIFCLLVVCGNVSVSAQKMNNRVILEGRLLNFGAMAVLEDFSEIQYMVPDSYNRKISLKEDSSFSIAFNLESPGYFRLGRSKLYLSPGDSMYVVLDHSNSEKSVFKGKGSAANYYLRKTPFPKAGSYIEAGMKIMPTPVEMFRYILKTAKERENELTSTKGISTDFVKLEKARIKADIIMSIMRAPSYSGIKFSKETAEFRKSYIEEFNRISKSCKDSLLHDFVDPFFLQVEVYRDIYNELNLKEGVKPAGLQIMNDWKKANSLAYTKIKPLNDKSTIPALRNTVDSIKTKKYRDILNLLLDDKMKFGTGDPARDISVRNSDGTSTTLSSLKGKVIYIDIWATWCGPCMGEMPYLESLKKKYDSNTGIAIVSLSVDDTDKVWLKDLEKRKPGGIQWRIDRPKLSEYEVLSIPRFILIDKNFSIADMHALSPSDTGLIKMIDALVSK